MYPETKLHGFSSRLNIQMLLLEAEGLVHELFHVFVESSAHAATKNSCHETSQTLQNIESLLRCHFRQLAFWSYGLRTLVYVTLVGRTQLDSSARSFSPQQSNAAAQLFAAAHAGFLFHYC